MKKHSAQKLALLTCPFAVPLDNKEWDRAEVISTDDFDSSVIVKIDNGDVFLVNVPKVLYKAIMEAGEDHVIQGDPGFDEIA